MKIFFALSVCLLGASVVMGEISTANKSASLNWEDGLLIQSGVTNSLSKKDDKFSPVQLRPEEKVELVLTHKPKEELPEIFAYVSGEGSLINATNVTSLISVSNQVSFVFQSGKKEGFYPATLVVSNASEIIPFFVGDLPDENQSIKSLAPPGGWAKAEILRADGKTSPENRRGVFNQMRLKPNEEVEIKLKKKIPEGMSVYAYTVHGGRINGEHRTSLTAGKNGALNFKFQVAQFGGNYPLILRYGGREEVLHFWVDLDSNNENEDG